MALNAKVCKETNRNDTRTYTTSSNDCNHKYIIHQVYKYKNGQNQIIQNFKDGKEDGITKRYHENGKLSYEQPYNNGTPIGTHKRYLKDGKLYSETTFKNGKQVTSKSYFRDGKLSTLATFIDGKEDTTKLYYNSGVLKSDEKFSNGNRTSRKEYFENKKIKAHLTFKTNTSSGSTKKATEQTYNEDGLLLKDLKFVNGKKNGVQMNIRKRRGYKFRTEIIYKDDKKVGEKNFDNNRLSREFYYENGKQVKKMYSYNIDGKLTKIYNKTTKKTTYYNLDGSVDRVE